MSISRSLPLARPLAPRRHLRPVSSAPAAPKVVRESRFTVATQVRFRIGRKILVGLVSVLFANLMVNMACNQAIYSISTLKSQTAELATKTQILEQQVDSLRSPQNLANSARSLGMIVNSNSVFLKVSTGKVLGAAIPASVSTSGAVSSNLIANAAMITKSNPTKSSSTKLDIPQSHKVSQSVKTTSSGYGEVVLPSSGIPASPTH